MMTNTEAMGAPIERSIYMHTQREIRLIFEIHSVFEHLEARSVHRPLIHLLLPVVDPTASTLKRLSGQWNVARRGTE
jgi:hypothetical protein